MPSLEERLDDEIRKIIKDSKILKEAYDYLTNNKSIRALQEMANIVMVVRSKYNDHGVVHAKITTLNALKIVNILKETSITREKIGTLEDATLIVMVSSYLHDLGNAIHRHEHEVLSVVLARPFVEEILEKIYEDEAKRQRIASVIYECIFSHMGHFGATSIEAGIVATADGCDMEKGRARVPYKLGKPGIHTFSALSIEKVEIKKGRKKPIRIEVTMNDASGVFQIEEILMRKVRGTNFQDYVEVVGKIGKKEEVEY